MSGSRLKLQSQLHEWELKIQFFMWGLGLVPSVKVQLCSDVIHALLLCQQIKLNILKCPINYHN